MEGGERLSLSVSECVRLGRTSALICADDPWTPLMNNEREHGERSEEEEKTEGERLQR